MSVRLGWPVIFPALGFALGWTLASPERITQPAVQFGSATGTQKEEPRAESAQGSSDSKTNFISPAHDVTREAASKDKPRPTTLVEVLSHPSEFRRIGELAILLDGVRASQFPEWFSQLSSMKPPPGDALMALFFRRWALVDPREALNASIPADSSTPVLMAWAESDPDAALAAFEKLTSIQGFFAASTRDHLRKMAMPKPGQLPPREAVLRIRELQGDAEATPAVLNSISAILREWAKADPEAAWQEALALSPDGPGKETREWSLATVIRAQVGVDPAQALAWIDALPPGPERERREVDYVAALAWQGKQRLAQEYAFALPSGTPRIKAIGEIMSALHRSDPVSARSLLLGLSADDWRDPTEFSDVLQGWMRSDPEKAVETLLQRFPFDDPTLSEKQQAYDRMFFGFADRHPEVALDLYLKLPESVGKRLLENGVATFASLDPVAASKWATELPEGARRDEIHRIVAEQWTGRGVSAVTSWLQQLPKGTGKAAAIEGFAGAIISESPDDALAWLRSIPAESDRLAGLRRVWDRWKDRETARRWAESSPELNERERSALIGPKASR